MLSGKPSNATANATPNVTKNASRNATNVTSSQWESFGSLWKGQFDFYKYRGDNLTHVLTDDVQEILALLGTWKDAKLTQVKIFGSGIPDATTFMDYLRPVLNSLAIISITPVLLMDASIVRFFGKETLVTDSNYCQKLLFKMPEITVQEKPEITVQDAIKLRGKAIDNTWMHHDFVIIICEMNGRKLFVSMEKMTHAIVIQTAEDEKPLREKIQNMPRENVFNNPFQVDDCKDDRRLHQVMARLVSPSLNELARPYNLLLDNCQHFAQRLFEFVAHSKMYPNNVMCENVIFDSLKEKLLKTE